MSSKKTKREKLNLIALWPAPGGIAPYEYSSGSSVNGKSQTSRLANKKIKILLANGANSAIVHDKELKQYFWRKVEMGKPKMLVINAVKSKMIHRVFAAIKRGSGFVDIKKYAAWKNSYSIKRNLYLLIK